MAHGSVSGFVDDRVEQDSTNWVPFRDLWAEYVDFCNEAGYPAVGSRQALGRQLRDALEFDVISSRRIPQDEDKQIGGLTGLRISVDE